MAKYDITYHCGHTATVQLYGPHKERERKIAWYGRQGLCPACYQAAQDAERAQTNAAAAATNASAGLIALTGSPKQVAWAESIRADFVARFGRGDNVKLNAYDGGAYIAKAQAAGLSTDEIKARLNAVREVKAAAIAKALSHDSAAWWIETQHGIALAINTAVNAAYEQQFGE